MPKFKSKSKPSAKIPMASIPDIVFLLLIFFMTVTVFKQYQGLKVTLPTAKATKKIEAKRMITHIWIDAHNNINIDDVMVRMIEVAPIMKEKMMENPATIVSIFSDKDARYGSTARVMEELKKAEALRVNFATRMGD